MIRTLGGGEHGEQETKVMVSDLISKFEKLCSAQQRVHPRSNYGCLGTEEIFPFNFYVLFLKW